MAEQNKNSPQPANNEHQQMQPIYTIQQPGLAPYAPYPPYMPYAAPPPPNDVNGHGGEANAANGPPPGAYMMAIPPPPPGMIYAYPTAQGYPTFPLGPGMSLPSALVRPKRKQVKMACTNCAQACKRCDEARPCERCCKYGISESCIDGQRKERKKGIKRGPYKRKGKISPDESYEGFPQDQSPQASFYPSYFYPPPGFVPIGPDGQPMQHDGTGAGQPGMHAAHPQYYPLHPAYPPFAAYPHPMMAGPMPTMNPQAGASSDGGAGASSSSGGEGDGGPIMASTSKDGASKDGGEQREPEVGPPRSRKRGRHTAGASQGASANNEQVSSPPSSKRAGKRPATDVGSVSESL